jgi:hypothetical protein
MDMPKSGTFDVVLGGGIVNGVATATATISKDGKPWLKNTTEYLTMTPDQFTNLKAATDKFTTKKKLTGLNVHQLLVLYEQGANFLIDLGKQAAK